MKNMLSKEEIEAVVNADHSNPFAILGLHRDKGSKEYFVRTFHPFSKKIDIVDEKGKLISEMKKIHAKGFYQAELGKDFSGHYLLKITYDDGNTCVKEDVYRFAPTLGDIDVYLFAEGNHHNMYKKLGAHLSEQNGVKGVSFGLLMLSAFRWLEILMVGMAELMLCAITLHAECGIYLFRI